MHARTVRTTHIDGTASARFKRASDGAGMLAACHELASPSTMRAAISPSRVPCSTMLTGWLGNRAWIGRNGCATPCARPLAGTFARHSARPWTPLRDEAPPDSRSSRVRAERAGLRATTRAHPRHTRPPRARRFCARVRYEPAAASVLTVRCGAASGRVAAPAGRRPVMRAVLAVRAAARVDHPGPRPSAKSLPCLAAPHLIACIPISEN